MKGIMPLVLIVVILAVVALLGMRPGSIVDDCTKIAGIPNRIPYARDLNPSMIITAGSGSGDYSRAILVTEIPTNAKLESITANLMFNGNAFGRPTQRTISPSVGIGCTGYVIMAYEGDPAVGWVASDGGTMDYTNLGGTYTVNYHIKFTEMAVIMPMPTPVTIPTPTPASGLLPIFQPTSTPTPTPTPTQNDRIFILSDVFDGLKSIVAGIIAFVAIPFIPPAP